MYRIIEHRSLDQVFADDAVKALDVVRGFLKDNGIVSVWHNDVRVDFWPTNLVECVL